MADNAPSSGMDVNTKKKKILPFHQISLNGLSEQEIVCFFLNVYNTLLLHAALVAGTSKKALMSRFYVIAGMKFTLSDIEIGIFRGMKERSSWIAIYAFGCLISYRISRKPEAAY